MSSRTPKPAARPAAGASATPAAKPVAASARVVRTPAGAASRTAAAGAAPVDAARGDGRQKVARHVDERVAARNTSLNVLGGVKVDVFVRVRPPTEIEANDPIVVSLDKEAATVTLTDNSGYETKYAYDKVYGIDSTQEQLYNDAVAPIVEQVCRGLSCCIFAYGQTGAGKTYTMRGDLSSDPSKHGIIQRSLNNLFRRLKEQDYTDIEVNCSFLEIYNEGLEDLFVDPVPVKKGMKPVERLTLVDHKKRGCVVNGLTEVAVDLDAEDNGVSKLIGLLTEAEARCKYSETKMNKLSNRAHRIFTLLVTFKRYDKQVEATLTFVDLAGSEDISKSGATGLTAREASHINKSLLTLGRVINALACNERHIPYRDSKLTRLLSEALGGVCKTSFIACVSPCASSAVETNSTLRYAERAMEALNISQLPRWKQDEIIIDGLTRRVQQLESDLESMHKIHQEEMNEMVAQRDALKQTVHQLRRDIGKAERKIERLRARKAELKAGTALLDSQKQVLLSQKQALQEELLETRSVRDGYLADRQTLNSVLKTVREMREALLAAHRSTEDALTGDALELKRVIEGAVEDIDELHTEVARKKALSVHNEKVADDFRDRISSKLRALVQSVVDFRTGQDQHHSGLKSVLADVRARRQQDTNTLLADVQRITSQVQTAMTDISLQAKDIEAARQGRIAQGQEAAAAQLQQVREALERTQRAVAQRMQELAQGASSLSSNLDKWADRVRTQLEETTSQSARFTSDVVAKVTALEAHLASASNQQLQHLAAHRGALASYLEEEKTTLDQQAQRMIEDISGFVNRLVRDHVVQSQHRAEAAVSGFTATTLAAEEQVRELMTHQNTAFAGLKTQVSDRDAQLKRHQQQSAADSAAHQASSQAILKEMVSANDAGGNELRTLTQKSQTLAQEQHDQRLAALKEDSATAKTNQQSLEKLVVKGRQEHEALSKALKAKADADLAAFGKQAEDMGTRLGATQDDVRKHSGEAHDDLFDSEAEAIRYVEQEILRDVQEAPGRKDYVYPTEYAATPAYEELLAQQKADWEREHKINTGSLAAGRGIDFPGEPGPDDFSGLLTTTLEKPPTTDETRQLDRAMYQSDVGEYSDPEGFVDPLDAEDDEDGGVSEEAVLSPKSSSSASAANGQFSKTDGNSVTVGAEEDDAADQMEEGEA